MSVRKSELPNKVEILKISLTPLVLHVMSKMDSLSICPGHPDTHFVKMLKAKKKCTVDTCSDVLVHDKTYSATTRLAFFV